MASILSSASSHNSLYIIYYCYILFWNYKFTGSYRDSTENPYTIHPVFHNGYLSHNHSTILKSLTLIQCMYGVLFVCCSHILDSFSHHFSQNTKLFHRTKTLLCDSFVVTLISLLPTILTPGNHWFKISSLYFVISIMIYE